MAVVSVTPKAPTGVGVSARGVRGPQGPALELRDEGGVIEWRIASQTPADEWKALLDVAQYVEDSEAARNLAQQWATEDEDVAVSGGLYSAFHHALKAAASASAASGSAGTATSARSDAEDARDLAAGWAEKADGVDVDGAGTRSAKHHAGVAAAAAGTASSKAEEASGHADDAEDARDLARDWAEKAEDSPVEVGQFSAKHHAMKAAASALAAATFDPASYTLTEDLADVALSGAYGDLSGTPTLFDGAYGSLSGRPTLGDAAALAVASAANIAALSGGDVMSPEKVNDALALATPSGAANWAPDWATFIGATWVITANRTLSNPTNVIAGTTRVVTVKSSSASERTMSFGSNFKGALPTVKATNAAFVTLFLYAVSATEILVSDKGW